MPRYVFIRHGESVWNGERRIQGNQDPALSERGRRQADLLVVRMNDTHHLTAAGADLAPRDVLVDGGAADTTV